MSQVVTLIEAVSREAIDGISVTAYSRHKLPLTSFGVLGGISRTWLMKANAISLYASIPSCEPIYHCDVEYGGI